VNAEALGLGDQLAGKIYSGMGIGQTGQSFFWYLVEKQYFANPQKNFFVCLEGPPWPHTHSSGLFLHK
jgi:hypothetical protein